jgi:CHAT domain-containing protein
MHPGVRRALSAASILTACVIAGAEATPARLVDRLSALAPARTLRARLSIDVAYQPCAAPAANQGAERIVCDARVERRKLMGIAARASAQAGAAPTADALHASALADLLEAASDGEAPDLAIQSLRSAARLSDRPAPVLADLAAALLLRAELAGSARDVVEAIEVSQEAAELEPGNAAVLFNRALAMEQWGLVDRAAAAWRRYREADPGSRWADEAERRAGRLASLPRPSREPRDFSPAAVRRFAADWPQQARQLGFDRLLGDWGAAVLGGDAAAAESALRRAELLGLELRARGRDRTLADAVLAIRQTAGDAPALRLLARGHRAYAAGVAANDRVDFIASRDSFAAATRFVGGSRALAAWSRASYGSALVSTQDTLAARTVLAPLLGGVDTAAYPAVAGRVRWALGTLRLRQGSHQEALESARHGSELLRRAGEEEFAAGAAYSAADAAFSLGANLEAYEEARRALALLRRFAGSRWTSNALSSAARIAGTDEFLRAALTFQEERLAAARHSAAPRKVTAAQTAEAQVARAQVFAALGDRMSAERAAATAATLVARLDSGTFRSWQEADLQLVRARLRLADRPARAVATFDSVVALPITGATVYRLLQALGGRAQARLARGDVDGGLADLDSAAAQIGRESRAVLRASYRSSLLDAATGVFDRIVMLKLARGDTTGALAALEHGRVSFASAAGAAGRPAPGIPRPPPGTLALEYALIGDTLLAWTVRGDDVRLARVTLARDSLARVSERLRVAVARGEDEARLRPQLAWLYEALVRPVAARLGPPETRLTIVADGDVPADLFTALFDSRSGRYLVQDYLLAFAPTLPSEVPAAAPARGSGGDGGVLIAANPAFEPGEHRGLEPLPEADVEADSVAALYSTRVGLRGREVTPEALAAAVPRARVFHFAGHAVFNGDRPDRSYLVLAPGRAGGYGGSLTAGALSGADWSGVRLVVLSACETLPSRRGRSAGFAGFAAALLGAGAGGVVGGSWKVDDRSSRHLMVEFHRAYRASGDGAAALRAAQLKLLGSSDATLRSPTAWAAFRYAGN